MARFTLITTDLTGRRQPQRADCTAVMRDIYGAREDADRAITNLLEDLYEVRRNVGPIKLSFDILTRNRNR